MDGASRRTALFVRDPRHVRRAFGGAIIHSASKPPSNDGETKEVADFVLRVSLGFLRSLTSAWKFASIRPRKFASDSVGVNQDSLDKSRSRTVGWKMNPKGSLKTPKKGLPGLESLLWKAAV
eukprot:7387056-Prymnesium_polylepis.1